MSALTASLSVIPARFGTVTFAWPCSTVMVIVSPWCIWVLAAGSWATTVPSAWVVSLALKVTVKLSPTRCASSWAWLYDSLTRFGA